MNAAPAVVVVGGGFAGTTLARALQRRLPDAWRLVLISEESYTTFNPMLAEVVGAAVFPEQVVAPIRQMLDPRRHARTQFVMGRVTEVDRQRRELQVQTLAGPLVLPYGHLVLAIGSRAHLDLVPGMAEHALALKLVGDAMAVRNRVLQRVARIELETDPDLRRRLGRFVVVGGGFSGVEVAGAVADFLHQARRWYPRAAAHELQVTLLHDGDRLLPELPPALGDAAARSLAARGVELRLGCRAAAVDEGGVRLADGEYLAGATVVCTIGSRPQPLAESIGVPVQRGRIEVAGDGSVPGAPGLWALGDCAALPNAATGQLSPPTAQFAVAQARQLAHNLLAQIDGRPTRAFAYRSRGMMATTGHRKGVALVFGWRFAGLPAWLMWRAYYLLRMPTLGRKLRIWVEWTWSMCFTADITHLRFSRTGEADATGMPNAAGQRRQHAA